MDRIDAGKARCLALKRFSVPRADYDQVDEVAQAGVSSKRLAFSVDAFGYFRARGRGDVIYVALTEDSFAECAVSD